MMFSKQQFSNKARSYHLRCFTKNSADGIKHTLSSFFHHVVYGMINFSTRLSAKIFCPIYMRTGIYDTNAICRIIFIKSIVFEISISYLNSTCRRLVQRCVQNFISLGQALFAHCSTQISVTHTHTHGSSDLL